MEKLCNFFCPICRQLVFVIGKEKNKKLLSCAHRVKFTKSRSQKEMDRKFVMQPWGLELVEDK